MCTNWNCRKDFFTDSWTTTRCSPKIRRPRWVITKPSKASSTQSSGLLINFLDILALFTTTNWNSNKRWTATSLRVEITRCVMRGLCGLEYLYHIPDEKFDLDEAGYERWLHRQAACLNNNTKNNVQIFTFSQSLYVVGKVNSDVAGWTIKRQRSTDLIRRKIVLIPWGEYYAELEPCQGDETLPYHWDGVQIKVFFQHQNILNLTKCKIAIASANCNSNSDSFIGKGKEETIMLLRLQFIVIVK